MADAAPDHGGPSALERPLPYDTVERLLIDKLSTMLGGWRGAIESAIPLLVFAIVWARTANLRTSLLLAGGSVVVMLVLAVVQRADLRFIGYAAAGLAISAFFALRTGKAEAAFLPGMIQNGATCAAMLLGNLLRWPLLGFVVGAADTERFSEAPAWWHRHPGIVAVSMRLGWVLVVLGVLRLAVMVPLYVSGHTSQLAVAKIVLGWPAYLVAVTIMGAMLLRGHTPIDPDRHSGASTASPPGTTA